MEEYKNTNMKTFIIKLVAITLSIIIIINVIFNLIFAERLEKIDKIFEIFETQKRGDLKDKIKKELYKGLAKDQMIKDEDKELLYKVYQKIKSEFEQFEKDAK